MRRPFQCLLAYPSDDPQRESKLLAAAGSHLYVLNSTNGKILSSWSTERGSAKLSQGTSILESEPFDGGTSSKVASTNQAETENLPPDKKRKLSITTTDVERTPAVDSGLRADPRSTASEVRKIYSAIVQLAITKDKKSIVIASDHDKCIRVLALDGSHELQLLSERHMPKRPCAVVISHDDTVILSADKFGDVYALPLFSLPQGEGRVSPSLNHTGPTSALRQLGPTANERTVHTLRNQQALKNQLMTVDRRPERERLRFEHQLIIGHVSLLTDLAIAPPFPKGASSGSYIITADRDEHIRVSRGISQAHIIESYCFGHTQFVSKICLLSWDSDLLVSGGGEDTIFLWKWVSGNVVQRFDLRSALRVHFEKRDSTAASASPLLEAIAAESIRAIDESNEGAVEASQSTDRPTPSPQEKGNSQSPIAVSGLWDVGLISDAQDGIYRRGQVAVAVEGIPALIMLSVTSNGHIGLTQTLTLRGNPLDVAILAEETLIIVSIDNVHKPGSTCDLRAASVSDEVRLQVFAMTRSGHAIVWEERTEQTALAKKVNEGGGIDLPDPDIPQLKELLYSAEKLRKRGPESRPQ
ncbi:MAG: tRNA (guanine-N(7)-)-methyltransferase non-catalytic subunit trm82 [Piccolia ochrophora]|nr:MAG: tRNA (guanine-N(7)-)-methyltransferase non-catalytic subunit trm82 [Piccolia ochrophora]